MKARLRAPALLPLLVLAGCSSSGPQGAIDKLVQAIQDRDLDAYKSCFAKSALSGEAGLARLEADPERAWKELEDMFRGPQTVVVQESSETEMRVKVEAPEAEGGGIGSVRFVLEDGAWKIANW